jgi:hypothetical protein
MPETRVLPSIEVTEWRKPAVLCWGGQVEIGLSHQCYANSTRPTKLHRIRASQPNETFGSAERLFLRGRALDPRYTRTASGAARRRREAEPDEGGDLGVPRVRRRHVGPGRRAGLCRQGGCPSGFTARSPSIPIVWDVMPAAVGTRIVGSGRLGLWWVDHERLADPRPPLRSPFPNSRIRERSRERIQKPAGAVLLECSGKRVFFARHRQAAWREHGNGRSKAHDLDIRGFPACWT